MEVTMQSLLTLIGQQTVKIAYLEQQIEERNQAQKEQVDMKPDLK